MLTQRELSAILRKSSSKSFTSYEQLLVAYDTHGNFVSMFRNQDLILSVVIYGMASLCQMSFDTIYPLTLMNNRAFGGFEMDALEESWIATTGVALQIASRTCRPRLVTSAAFPIVEPTDAVPRPAGDLLAAPGGDDDDGASRLPVQRLLAGRSVCHHLFCVCSDDPHPNHHFQVALMHAPV